jgi:hypothetical protein
MSRYGEQLVEDTVLEEELKRNLEINENLEKNLVKDKNENLLKSMAEQTINDLFFQLKLREYENSIEKNNLNKKIDELLLKVSKYDHVPNNKIEQN